LEKTGLINKITEGVGLIAEGRRRLMTKGKAEVGLSNFSKGHEIVLQAFKDALASGDPEIMLLAELVYDDQELIESRSREPVAENSTETAVGYFEAAMDTLPLTRDKELYKAVNTAFSPHPDQRHKGFPKDAVHMACASDLMRIKNGLSRIGIPEADISLASARTAMLKAAQEAYCARQQKALQETELQK
jgi:hypothetical protein